MRDHPFTCKCVFCYIEEFEICVSCNRQNAFILDEGWYCNDCHFDYLNSGYQDYSSIKCGLNISQITNCDCGSSIGVEALSTKIRCNATNVILGYWDAKYLGKEIRI